MDKTDKLIELVNNVVAAIKDGIEATSEQGGILLSYLVTEYPEPITDDIPVIRQTLRNKFSTDDINILISEVPERIVPIVVMKYLIVTKQAPIIADITNNFDRFHEVYGPFIVGAMDG